MRLLITGANGFAGRHLITHLQTATPAEHIAAWVWNGAADDTELTAVDRTDCIDLRQGASVAAALRTAAPEVVFHLAAAASVAASWHDPALTFAVNLGGTANLLDAAAQLEPPPLVVMVTSGEIYGPTQPGCPAREDDPPQPASPYALSKADQDRLASGRLRPPIVRLRPFSHTGPGQHDRFAIPSFARQIAAIEAGLCPPRLAVGNLDAVRDIGDVRDVVTAYGLVANAAHAGQVYNVATGHGHRIGDVLEQLCGLARCPIEVVRDPAHERPADVQELVGDASRLTAATGWRPQIPLATTLADILEWWRRRTRA